MARRHLLTREMLADHYDPSLDEREIARHFTLTRDDLELIASRRGDATRLYEAMLYKGVIVRAMRAYFYPECIRITVGTEAENRRFVAALGECLQELGYVRP